MSYKDIAKLIPTIQAADLVSHNLKKSKKKKKTKDMLEMGMENIVGVNLIKAEAQIVGGL